MGALKDGNNEEYERSSNMFMDLAEKGDHLSSVEYHFILVFSWEIILQAHLNGRNGELGRLKSRQLNEKGFF